MMTQNYENKMVTTIEIKDKDGNVIGTYVNQALSKETIEALINWVPSSLETDKKDNNENS